MSPVRTNADRDHAIELYTSGLSTRQITDIMRADTKWIRRVIHDAGLMRNRQDARLAASATHPHWQARNRTDISSVDIVGDYQSGIPATEIAKRLGVSTRVVRARLNQGGIPLRSRAEARLLIDREKAAATVAEGRSRKVGWGEDLLYDWLVERGEVPDPQFPVGIRNIDIALAPIAVEVWTSSISPLADPYCRDRIKYLADRGWASVYIFVARRTRTLLPCVADEVIRIRDLARANPSAPRQHWVIRGCGERAAVFGDNLDHGALIPPAISCGYHSSINKSVRR